jgi:hypothetical protein
MPTPVSLYFTSMNALDSSGMVSAFADDGFGERRAAGVLGSETITRRADREIDGNKAFNAKFTEAQSHHGGYIVKAEVDGEYDKTGLPIHWCSPSTSPWTATRSVASSSRPTSPATKGPTARTDHRIPSPVR